MSLLDWFSGGTQQNEPQQPGQPAADWMTGQGTPPILPEEEPLPKGAISRDPFGNPYFGEGISGILKKWQYNFTKDIKQVDDSEWEALRERWKNINAEMQKPVEGGGRFGATPEAAQKGRERASEFFGAVGESVSKAWQAGSAQGSLLSPVLKFTGASITSLGELFSIPAQKLEQTFGAATNMREAIGELESPLPKLDGTMETLLYLTPIGGAYDFARLVFSPAENKWDKVSTAIEEGWQSGRIFYSQLFDETLKQQFLQEYREGRDPALLAMKLQNPLAELGGQAFADPLNLVGVFAKGAKTAKELDAAVEAVTESGLLKTAAGKAAFKAISEATDDVSGARALDDLLKAQAEAVTGVTKGSKLLNVGYSAESLTTTSRQNSIISKGKTLLGNMALALKEEGFSYDGIAEGILSGIRAVSSNADEMRRGLAGLVKLPNANMWLADDYVESFVVLNRMMANAEGVVDGAKLKNLTQIKSPTAFSQEVTRLYLSAAKGQYREVKDMEKAFRTVRKADQIGSTVSKETRALAETYRNLPSHVKILDKINNVMHRATDPINRVLFPAYFNLQGGVAVRNVVTNNELVFLDKGIGAWFKDGKIWSNENVALYLKDLYGELPEAAHGFKSLVAGLTGREAWGFGKWMERGEETAAIRIVGAVVRDTLKKMFRKAVPDLSRHIEAGTLTERQAKKLFSLIEKNNYKVTEALEQFRDFYKIGNVEDWRNLDFITDFEREALESMDLMRDIEDLAHRGAVSQNEVEEVFARLKRVIDDRAQQAIKDAPGLSPDHPGVEAWGDLALAAEEGHFDPDMQQAFTAFMEAAEQSRLEYQSLLDDLMLKAQQALNQEGKAQQAMSLGGEMNRVRDVLRRGAPVTAREAHELTQGAWRFTDEVKDFKKNNGRKAAFDDLAAIWTRAGLNGAPPLDLDAKQLLGEIWAQRFQKVSELWNNHFDTIVGESEIVLKQMEGIVDTTELKAMASQTRHITQQAQATRMAAYSNGAMKIIPKFDVEYVAKKFGVTTDEIITALNNKTGQKYETLEDIPTKDIMDIIAQVRGDKGLSTTVGRKVEAATKTTQQAAKEITLATATKTPVHELPPTVQERFEQIARQLLDELSGGEAGRRVNVTDIEGGAEVTKVKGISSTNAAWYRKLYGQGVKSKKVVESALEKIIADGGKDKGVNVERMKDLIIERIAFGDEVTGTPPDLYVLKQLGADEKQLQKALDSWNDITKQEMTLDEAIEATTPTAELLHSKDQPYFDEAGNLVEPQAVEIPPPHPIGTEPSAARAWNENARGAKYTLDNIKNEIIARWGKTNAERVPSEGMDAVLNEISKALQPRIPEMKAIALRIAKKARDFALLDYGEKTYGDVAKAFVLPFHFFYTRSYKNWIRRLGTDPEIVSHYGQYKDFLEAENKNLPDWYKQQLNINPFAGDQSLEGKSFLGIPANHPLFVNLEATFNPLYGLTGTDYNDPIKRNNWATATIDDMGKFGPTMYAPIQLGIAAMLFKDGETDVAARWAGRLFPETTQIKALTSTLLGHPVELDPAVLFFSGGIDSQERGRMSYAAAQLIQSGQFTPEEIMSQFQVQQGAAWDTSYQMAVQSRAASAATSYFLGVGFKPRSTNDVMVEEMYTQLNKLYAMADMMPAEKYRMAWEQLRSQYPDGFVDTVLLSRKGGDKRDAALAYEVLNRIPPGNMSEALASIGLSQDEISRFYDSKGFTSPDVKYSKQEKDRFMAAVIDLSAMLKIPQSATRQEWAEARATYSTVYKNIEEELGEDIWEKVSLYYDLKDDNRDKAQQFGLLHPEIFLAQQKKREAVLSTPVLAAYYGSIETIEVYLDGKIRQELSNKYGADIYEIQNGYYASPNPRGYLAQHPELKQFWSAKRMLEKDYEPLFYKFAGQLPDGKSAQFREEFTPQTPTQKQLYRSLQAQPKIPSWEQVSVGMPEWFQSEISRYAETGAPLSKRGQKELDFLAKAGGYYDGQSLLRMAVLAMQQPFETGQGQQPAGGGLLEWYNQP